MNSNHTCSVASLLRFSGLLLLVLPLPSRALTATAAPGQIVTFSVTAEGNPPFAYRWFKDGQELAGATAAEHLLNSAAALDAGTYVAEVRNAMGATLSDAATLTVAPVETAPVITASPASQTVFAGAAVSFSGSASGTPAPAYQWLKDGVPLPGATAGTFTLATVSLADAGMYTLTATNSVGTATSAPAVLTVNPPLTAPVFALQPVSQTVFAGAPVSFTASASGNPAPAYQWRRDGTAIAGATNATFSLAVAALADTGTYTLTATNSVGTATSAPAVLTVNPPLTAPVFALQPVSQTVFAGAPVSFTASASGNPAPAYQWRRDGTAIAGATNATFSLASAALADTGTYTLTATNSVGTATSAPAVLTVAASSGAPVFTLQPVSQSVMKGGSVALAAAASGNPAPTIQWLKDGVVLPGATGGVYGITNVVAGSAGAYQAVAQNSAGSVTSATALITVSPAPALPVITSQPVGQTVIVGATVTFTVIATGSPAPTYRWCLQVKSGRTVTKTYLSGATNPSLTLTNVTTANAGTYAVEVTNSAGTITSAGAILKVTTTSTKGPKTQTTLASGTTVAAALPSPFADTLRVDFNADRRADLVFQHLSSGAAKAWLQGSPARQAELQLAAPTKAWRLAAAADFNGDGAGDLVWQHSAAAAAEIHLLTGAKRIGTVSLSKIPSTWQLAAAGDFTGDGQPDLVFQASDTGERTVLALHGLHADGLLPLESLPVEWNIAGAGDFNADGATDLLLENLLTGECQLWLLRGTATLGRASLGRPGALWEPAGATDLNGDGRSDILWEHPGTGERLAWLLVPSGAPVAVPLGRENPGWLLAH